MRIPLPKTWRGVLAALAVWLGAGEALAQSRQRVTLSGPGEFRAVGQSGASWSFSRYSYGVGNLAKSVPAPGGGVLSSSIGRRGSLSLDRGRRAGGSGLSRFVAGPAISSKRLYRPGTGSVGKVTGGKGFTRALMSPTARLAGAASAYLATFGPDQPSVLAEQGGAVTSLVPHEPSRYRDHMAEGERCFKDGRFEEAYWQFKLAGYAADKDPASLLSLAHASFARSLFSYGEAALYLRRALQYRPELALDRLVPKAFFGRTAESAKRYAAAIGRLEKRLADVPDDTDGLLVLAYFRWFDGRRKAAKAALQKAASLAERAKDAEMSEAVGTFLRGIAAAEQSAEPAPATQPAAQGAAARTP